MQDIIFALLLMAFNIVLFLVTNSVKVAVSKKILAVLLTVILAAIVIAFALNPEQYRATFFMSIALFLVMGMRFTIYKFLAPSSGNDSQGGGIVRKVFDWFLFPFFVLFISFGQIMFLFVWNS